MNLGELVDYLRVAILNDRSDRVEGTSDYLWTDARLVQFINEAQRRFAVKGLVIRDSTTAECCEVTLVEGQSTYTLHEAVIAVISAKLDAAVADLPRTGHASLNAYRQPSDDWPDTSQYSGLPPGAPLTWSTDEGLSDVNADGFSQVLLRVYPEPGEDQDGDVIRLRVIRKPLEPLRIGSLSAVPEIPEDHHIEMLDWAAYLALRIVDDDAGSPKRAAEFAAAFEEHVKNARNAAMRKLFAPTPWGFGRGGWGSWEH